MQDDLEVVPLHLMMAVQENGGLLLGAFSESTLVGCVLGFPGFTADGKPKHCSHLMAIAPAHQSSGIGYQLKLAQREVALARGFDLVTWTYDPLQSRNAYLNIHKLGGVSTSYLPNLYGSLMDGLNAGLPTDRLQVEWWISSRWVRERLVGGDDAGQSATRPGAAPIGEEVWGLRATLTAGGCLIPGEPHLDAGLRALRVEIPLDHQSTKSADLTAAQAWRLDVRRLFQYYFAAGYAAVDFVRARIDGLERGWYVLRRDSGEVSSHESLPDRLPGRCSICVGS